MAHWQLEDMDGNEAKYSFNIILTYSSDVE
jgi:hypothetical protein